MNNLKEILEIEEKYKKLLIDKLKGDKRLSLSSPDFKYPEPAFVYIKSVKTDKSIAVRLDGEDNTMRFWDYVDDDYSEEDGVWAKMTEKGLDEFAKKLYIVMNKAVDIEYFGIDGECEDYYSGIANFEQTPENAQKVVKKHGKDVDFVFAKYCNFFGDTEYVFDKSFKLIKK